MMSRRKSRRLSCSHHVRLPEKTFDLLEIPLSPGTFRHLKHGITFKLEIIRR
jgi:hypothetical protein